MLALLDAFKALTPWQIVVLIVVMFGAAGATYGGYNQVSNSGRTALADNQQLVPVRYGDLVNQVSTSGNLVFPIKETLAFGSSGKVEEVLAREGQSVVKGQVLARLDETTAASLEQAVAQAQVDLQSAEEALEELTDPSPLSVAQAQEKVADAALKLRQALENAGQLYAQQELMKQEEAVVSARLGLQEAEKALANLSRSHAQQLAQASQARADAEIALKAAQEALDNFQRDHALQLAQARQSRGDAEVALRKAEDDLSAFIMNPTRDPREPEELFDVKELQRLQVAVEVAQAGLVKAQDEVAKLGSGPDPAKRQEAEASLELAQANLVEAEKKLAELKDGVDLPALALKEASIALAQANLLEAEERLSELQDGPNALDLELKEKQMSLAQAETALAHLLAPDSLEVDLRQKQVALAQAALTEAEEALAQLLHPDPLKVALHESAVTIARLALDKAVQRNDDAVLKAPIDGVVSRVYVERGQDVNANTDIVQVVDPTIIEVDGVVDEIDVLLVQQNALATVTLDALPGQALEGIISEIAPVGSNQQGVVSYPIRVRVSIPEGVHLREGLSAVANIVLHEERDVLLVPQQSLRGSFDQPVVQVMTRQGLLERPVVVGNSDGFWVVVEQGLAAGEQVVMEARQAGAGQVGFGQFRAAPGGGGFISPPGFGGRR